MQKIVVSFFFKDWAKSLSWPVQDPDSLSEGFKKGVREERGVGGGTPGIPGLSAM